MAKHRQFTPEFKAQAVLDILTGARTPVELARQHGLSLGLLCDWKATFLAGAAAAFRAEAHADAVRARIAELERVVGRLALEAEIQKKAASWPAGTAPASGRRP
jgi:transposase-like protein